MIIDRNENHSALVLALDTCSPVMTMAIADSREVKASGSSDVNIPHSKTLFSLLDQLLQEAKVSLNEISLWATTTGPGSFTGLRVGLAAIKGLARATGKPLLGISTLEALARTVKHDSVVIVSILDSPRGDVFSGIYDVNEKGDLSPVVNEAVGSLDQVVLSLQALSVNRPVVFAGQGAISNIEKLRRAAEDAGGSLPVISDLESLSAGWNVVDKAYLLAPVIALQADQLLATGSYTGANPHYLRPSDAEIRA